MYRSVALAVRRAPAARRQNDAAHHTHEQGDDQRSSPTGSHPPGEAKPNRLHSEPVKAICGVDAIVPADRTSSWCHQSAAAPAASWPGVVGLVLTPPMPMARARLLLRGPFRLGPARRRARDQPPAPRSRRRRGSVRSTSSPTTRSTFAVAFRPSRGMPCTSGARPNTSTTS